jgi:multidrug transporter EmrE-like cation transporter
MSLRLVALPLLLVYVAISTSGMVLLKTAPGALSPGFAAGFALYAAGFALWYLLLTTMPLSVAFPLAAGSLIIGTQIMGYFFLNETLGFVHCLGVALLLAGIAVIYLATR